MLAGESKVYWRTESKELWTASEAMAKAWNCIGVIMRGIMRGRRPGAAEGMDAGISEAMAKAMVLGLNRGTECSQGSLKSIGEPNRRNCGLHRRRWRRPGTASG